MRAATASLTAELPSSPTAAVDAPPLGGSGAFWLAAAIVIFNLVDGLLTLAVVTGGLATEANPLMATGLGWGGVPFILLKTTLVSLGVYLLYNRRERPLARAALSGLTVVYATLTLYHVNSIDALMSIVS